MTIPTIDRDDLKAMRTADAVVFRSYRDGDSTIECVKKDRDEFGEKERRRNIAVYGSVYNGYDADGGRCRGEEMRYGCVVLTCAQYVENWRTVVSLLRVGDELRLEFRTDEATNGYVKDAGLHADELWLRVDRNNKRLYFLIETSICPSNSARMCRPA